MKPCVNAGGKGVNRRGFLTGTAAGVCGWWWARRSDAAEPSADWAVELGVCQSTKNAAMVKEAGFVYLEEGVSGYLMPKEPDEAFARRQAEVKTAALPVRYCNGFIPGDLKLVGPEPRHDDAVKYASTALVRAGKAGVRAIVLGSGGARRVPEGFDKEKALAQFVEFARRIAPVARDNGVTVVLEPLNRGETNFINSVSEGIGVVDAVGHEGFRLLADFYHLLREDEGPESIVKAGARLRHCHVAEKAERTSPGTKGDDFRPYLRALKQIGYRGGLSMECKWKNLANDLPVARRTLAEQIASV